jgi:hypothetical protein
MKILLLILFLSTLITGCAKQYPVAPVSWKTLPEYNVSYDKAWSTVLDVITKKNIELDVVQKDAGYIKSTSMFWGGQSFTLSVRFDNKSPAIIKLQTMGTLYNNYTGAPINTGIPNLEKVLLEEIEGRLRNLPVLSEAESIKKNDQNNQATENNPSDDTKTKLRKLQELNKEGLITAEEYETQKRKILESI